MRWIVAMLAVIAIGCTAPPPVTCSSPVDPPTCEDDAGDGYEWRVICDEENAATAGLSRYVGCGVSQATGRTLDEDDEAAACGAQPRCIGSEMPPRCVAAPCDGMLHRHDVL